MKLLNPCREKTFLVTMLMTIGIIMACMAAEHQREKIAEHQGRIFDSDVQDVVGSVLQRVRNNRRAACDRP
ncbi:unnamed protein product [Didymodactylos carnosus]|uniref:Uncharacterized protein n=1 Tax=Didymodactylos carnosus TaxID=1234261 RepID=A0A814NUL0_9BILA|nr:unnamed protein product [Didymodactylos carnosus]CAF3861933.1 unnamed protein product [Didymodactylos carnosus]